MNQDTTAAAEISAVVDTYDARLIREARELAALRSFDDKVNWLAANGHPGAYAYEDSTVHAIIAGNMQHVLSSLAAGYERELAAVKALTSRA